MWDIYLEKSISIVNLNFLTRICESKGQLLLYFGQRSRYFRGFRFVSKSFFFFFFLIYFWLCWVLGSCEGFLQLRQAGATLHRGAGTALHRGARAFLYRGPSRRGASGSRRAGSAIVAHGPSRPAACGILPDQGSNPRPLH